MNEQSSREAFQAGVDDALSGSTDQRINRSTAVNRSTASADAELAQTLLEMRREMAELRAATVRTPVPVSQVKSIRLRLAESDLLAGIVESPRSSLMGLALLVAGLAKYVDPAVLGEFLHLIESQGDAGAAGLAAAGVSLLFGKYGKGVKPVDGSIESVER